jgi:hypothetical protein
LRRDYYYIWKDSESATRPVILNQIFGGIIVRRGFGIDIRVGVKPMGAKSLFFQGLRQRPWIET